MVKPIIVGIGGTTRSLFSSERPTMAVLRETKRPGAMTLMLVGEKLASLPHFAPESAELTAERRFPIDADRATVRGWDTPIGITAVQTVFDSEGQIADANINTAVAGQVSQIMRLRSSTRYPRLSLHMHKEI